MRQMLESILAAIRRPPSVQPSREPEAERMLVMERTRGNLMIQSGQYSTEQDLLDEYNSFKEISVDAARDR